MFIFNIADVKLAAWDYVFELKNDESYESYIRRIVEFRDYLVKNGNSLKLANEVIAMEFSEQNTSSGMLFKKILADTESIEDMRLMYLVIEDTDSGVVLKCLVKQRMETLKSLK